jgi:hypothetical protein
MSKKELIKILSEILVPSGFKNKGNYWLINGDVISKMINLQKSQFANDYYINYGYILKSIPLEGLMMHIYNRLSSADATENNRIKELLNLENHIADQDRKKELKEFIIDKIISKIQRVNTEEDVLNELKKRQNLNDIPLIVKKYFQII